MVYHCACGHAAFYLIKVMGKYWLIVENEGEPTIFAVIIWIYLFGNSNHKI